jgi:hypothetical protein
MAQRLKTNPTIARLAVDLQLRGGADPSAAILRFCRKKIEAFLSAFPCPTLSQLLETACAHLDTVFIEIHDDTELRALEQRFLGRREHAFVNLAAQLGPEVFAITFALSHPEPYERRFVSVIDCRGEKAHRAYFSKWHELAHLLTLTSQMRLRFCRTHAEPAQKDPEEALMDVIAGDLGFYPPLVARYAEGRISFDKIEQLRDALCPEASALAATIGFVKAWPRPALLMQARLATRKEHQRQDGFDFHTPPSMALRAVRVTVNDAARLKGLLIPPNMRVPEISVIHRAFVDGDEPAIATEDLSWWESQGRSLSAFALHVEARRRHDHVEGLLTVANERARSSSDA